MSIISAAGPAVAERKEEREKELTFRSCLPRKDPRQASRESLLLVGPNRILYSYPDFEEGLHDLCKMVLQDQEKYFIVSEHAIYTYDVVTAEAEAIGFEGGLRYLYIKKHQQRFEIKCRILAAKVLASDAYAESKA